MSTEFINDQWRLPNAFNGTESNVNKQSNYSMDFNSSNSDYIDCGNDSVLTPTNAISISLWVKTSDTGNFIGLIDKWNGTSSTGYMLDLSASGANQGRPRFTIGSPSNSIQTTVTINDGNWHHIVATCDNTNGFIYLDGIQNNTASLTMSGISNLDNLKIAGDNASSNYLDGQIDAVSIFNYALSSSQVTTLYGSSSTGIGNPMSLSPKPVAYYPLGDQDAFNGANYLVPNSSLKDYVFNFSGSSVSTSSTYSELDTANKLTISFWAKSTSAVTSVPLNIGTNPNRQIYIAFFSSGRIMFIKNENGDATYLRADSVSPHDGNWNHILISMDLTASPRGNIYFNGNNITSQNTLDTNAIQTSTGSLLVGDSANFVGNIAQLAIWSGTDLRNDVATIYNNGSPNDLNNNGLTAPTTWWKLDASDTYDGTNWTIEDHAGSNDGTSSGMTQANLVQSDLSFTSGYSPYALDFDGTNDLIDLGRPSSLNLMPSVDAFSISAWFKTTSSGTIYSFGAPSSPSNTQIKIVIRGNATPGPYYPEVTLKGTATTIGSSAYNDGNWHNIILTCTTSTATLYIDGTNIGNPAIGTATITSTDNAAIGARTAPTGGFFFNGSISNVSVWNTALTSTQVTELYNEGVPSNLNNHSAYSNLVSWWQLGSNSSFNTNWTVLDEKGSNNGTSSNMGEDAIVDGVGSYANGLSSGMGGDEVIGDAPYSSSNSLSVNMDVLDRTEDTPS